MTSSKRTTPTYYNAFKPTMPTHHYRQAMLITGFVGPCLCINISDFAVLLWLMRLDIFR